MVGVVIGAAPVLIAVAAPGVTRRRPSAWVVVAAGIVVVGSGATQIGGGGRAASLAGIVATISALAGVAATSLLAAPVLPGSEPWPYRPTPARLRQRNWACSRSGCT